MASIDELREIIRDQTEEIERIASAPTQLATVLELTDDHALLATGKSQVSIIRPKADIAVGDSILVHAMSSQYIDHSPYASKNNLVTEVEDVRDNHAVISINGVTKLVPVIGKAKAGDRVLLDETQSIVLEVLAEKVAQKLETGVTWDDVGGQQEAKEALQMALEAPYKNPELFAHYGAKPASGILMYGPPGCGKTMLAKAAATSIGSAEGFLSVAGPEVLNEYVGVSERTIRTLFAKAKRYKAETGRRAVIFIDEAEALLGNRGARQAHMERTIVPTFLTQMDGMEESSATVILATNRSMALDPAVVREGRCDHKIHVSRPSEKDAILIFQSYLAKAPCAGSAQEFAEKATVALWAMSFVNSGERHVVPDHVTGSMIAGIVAKAKEAAMKRDLANKTMAGITLHDLGLGMMQAVQGMSAVALDTTYN